MGNVANEERDGYGKNENEKQLLQFTLHGHASRTTRQHVSIERKLPPGDGQPLGHKQRTEGQKSEQNDKKKQKAVGKRKWDDDAECGAREGGDQLNSRVDAAPTTTPFRAPASVLVLLPRDGHYGRLDELR